MLLCENDFVSFNLFQNPWSGLKLWILMRLMWANCCEWFGHGFLFQGENYSACSKIIFLKTGLYCFIKNRACRNSIVFSGEITKYFYCCVRDFYQIIDISFVDFSFNEKIKSNKDYLYIYNNKLLYDEINQAFSQNKNSNIYFHFS